MPSAAVSLTWCVPGAVSNGNPTKVCPLPWLNVLSATDLLSTSSRMPILSLVKLWLLTTRTKEARSNGTVDGTGSLCESAMVRPLLAQPAADRPSTVGIARANRPERRAPPRQIAIPNCLTWDACSRVHYTGESSLHSELARVVPPGQWS